MRRWMLAQMMILAVISSLFVACGSGGGVSENHRNRGLNPGVGPFDSRGNYVESWADDKSKGMAWRENRVVGAPQIAKLESTITPPVVATHITPEPKRPTVTSRKKPFPPVVGSTTLLRPRRKPTVSSRPKPTMVSKLKAKTKPKSKSPIRYKIKKGDTLYALSRKYKTSVSAIQRANGLKGTNLRIGKTLLIPRY